LARRIEVEIIGDSRSLERAFERSERSAKGFDRTMERAGRGAVVASVGFRGLGRAVGYASASFLGAAGFVTAIKSTVDAAEESQRVMAQTRNAVERSGLSWRRYSRQIEDVTAAQSKMSGFDDERLKSTFSLLVRRTGDVTEALRLNALAANVARGANIDLEKAASIVQRAAVGQARGLAALGIEYDKTSTGAELLAQLQQKYGDSAARYANTAAGAQDRFRVAVENLQEALGKQLLPSITKVANRTADWLNKADNQKKIVDDFAASVHVLAGALGAAARAAGFLKSAYDRLPDFGKNKGLVEIINGWWGSGNGFTGGPAKAPPGMSGPIGSRGGVMGGPPGLAGPVTGNAQAAAAAVAGALNTVGGISSFIDKWTAVGRKAAAAQKAAADYQTRMERQRGWLDFGIERAGSTKTLADDRRAYAALERFLQERIRHEGRTLELVRDLWRARQAVRDLNKKNADKDPLAGLMQVSTKQLTSLLAAGTGLGAAGRGRLAYNIAGAEIQPTHVHVHLDGREIAHSVTRHQARAGRRTASQTSGIRG
jgi:hypothetical protein